MNLTQCTNYVIEVRAENDFGLSNPVNVTVNTDLVVLEVPSNVTVGATTSSSITVRWTQEEWGPLCSVLNYNVSWMSMDDPNDLGSQVTDSTDFTITNLIPCSEYMIEIKSRNSEGYSKSSFFNSTTNSTVLMAPSDITEENVTTDSITISWTQEEWGPLCEVKNFSVSWNSIENDYGSETTDSEKFTITDLSACTNYNITIEAWNSVGPSESATYENETKPIAPGPPENIICESASSPNGFSVKWSEPNKTNCVIGYRVKYTGDVLWNDTQVNGVAESTNTSVDLNNLTPWTLYTVSIAGDIGNNEVGEFASCTMQTPEDIPGPPLLNQTHSDSNSITIVWDRPIEENGNLLGYNLTWGQNNYRNFTSNDTRAVIGSLKRRTSYNFTLWALTKAGEGQSRSVVVSTRGANVAAIVVPIVFGLILLVLLIIAYLNKDKLQSYVENRKQKGSQLQDGGNNIEIKERRPPPPPPPGPPTINVDSIKKENLRQYIRDLEVNSQEGLEREFGILKQMSPEHPTDIAKEFYNRPKNRFINILPFNDSRVILSEVQGSPGSEYINASYIWDVKGMRSFIAAQGPKENTTADFWRMIWEKKVYYIVMLTNLVEKGRDKCSKYWPNPEEGTVNHGSYSVQNHNEENRNFSTNRILEIQSGNPKRTLKHYHFTSWPDFGVPQHEDQLLDFISKIRTHAISSNKPMVVHCSGGVGSTGTFIALWNLMDKVDNNPNASEVNIKETILQMRQCRPMMVQSQAQYLYLCKCIAHYIENRDHWKQRYKDGSSYVNDGYQDTGSMYENDVGHSHYVNT